MSLQLAAQHLSHQGRFGDSTLVHMSPVEVAALQKLAEKHGMSLTINPETGLPEAFSLKKLLPAIIGFGLNMFAPGIGSAIGSALGTSAAVGTGLAVGGFEALRTGDLGRGLMAGLGAYGGASLGAGLSSLGSSAAENAAILAQTGGEEATGQILQEAARKGAADFAAQPFMDRLGQGVSAAINSPSALAQSLGGNKELMKTGLALAAPIVADEGVQTTTKMPTSEGYLRPYVYDPYTQGLTAMTPVSNKDAYAPPSPPGGKSGGLAAALAGGGAVAFADGGTTQKIQEWWKANEGKGDQAALDKWLATSGYSAADIAKALPQFSVTDLNKAIATAMTRQEVLDRQESRGLYQAAHEKLFPGTDPGFVITPHVDDPRNAYSKAILDEVKKMTAGQPAKTYSTTSAVPQEEIEAYKARLREKDPNLAEFMEWRLGEMDPMQHQRIGTLMAGKNPYDLDDNQFAQWKAAMERGAQRAGGTPEWLQADWRKTQAARNAAYDAEQERRRKEAAGSGFVIGGSGGGGSGGGGTGVGGGGGGGGGGSGGGGGGGGTGPITITPPPPPPPPYVRPDSFDPGKVPIDRLPTIEQKKPEDVMSGESLNAYLALMGKGSTATKQWDTAPMRPYLPGAGQSPFFIQRDGTVTKPSGVSTTTTTPVTPNLTNPAIYPSEPAGPGMEWYYDGSKWAKRPMTEINAAAGGGLMAAYADGGASSLGGYSDGGRLLRGPGDGVSDSIPATIANRRPARLADGEFVVPARIVSELGNGSTEAGARKLYAMMDRVQKARGKTTGKGRVAVNSRADKHLPA